LTPGTASEGRKTTSQKYYMTNKKMNMTVC